MKYDTLKYILLVIVIAGVNYRCERQVPAFEFSCQECYQDKPEWGSLSVKVTINENNPYVPIKVFIGNIEENNLDWVDTAYSSDYFVDVIPDRYYSITAEYNVGVNKVIAVDGDKLKIEHNSEDCDQPCYYFKGGYIDVQLRN